MKKLFWVALLAILASGCAQVVYPDGSRRRVPMTQVGVVLTVQNDCAPVLEAYQDGILMMANIRRGQHATFPLVSAAFTGSSREVEVLFKYYSLIGDTLNYLGSLVERFWVNIYGGSESRTVILRPGWGTEGCRADRR
jgi:hypothetical protein